ncbi:MAG: hypothetical protein QOH43_3956, partial [Solirubrobacteraceae bacterium]|nr:hypothetical protein [Solirubrobacteraceae bacterium]
PPVPDEDALPGIAENDPPNSG